jgi:hypothetical protein
MGVLTLVSEVAVSDRVLLKHTQITVKRNTKNRHNVQPKYYLTLHIAETLRTLQ